MSDVFLGEKKEFTATIHKESGFYVALSPEFNVKARGRSVDEALTNLKQKIGQDLTIVQVTFPTEKPKSPLEKHEKKQETPSEKRIVQSLSQFKKHLNAKIPPEDKITEEEVFNTLYADYVKSRKLFDDWFLANFRAYEGIEFDQLTEDDVTKANHEAVLETLQELFTADLFDAEIEAIQIHHAPTINNGWTYISVKKPPEEITVMGRHKYKTYGEQNQKTKLWIWTY